MCCTSSTHRPCQHCASLTRYPQRPPYLNRRLECRTGICLICCYSLYCRSGARRQALPVERHPKFTRRAQRAQRFTARHIILGSSSMQCVTISSPTLYPETQQCKATVLQLQSPHGTLCTKANPKSMVLPTTAHRWFRAPQGISTAEHTAKATISSSTHHSSSGVLSTNNTTRVCKQGLNIRITA